MTDNSSAIEKNTRSLDELRTAFERGSPLFGAEAQRFVSEEASRQANIQRVAERVAPRTESLDITVKVDGQSLRFQGTPEAIRELAQQVSTQVARAV